MRSSVCPTLTTAAIVHGLSTDHDRLRGQCCTVLTHPVSLIHRGISVQMNQATSKSACQVCKEVYDGNVKPNSNFLDTTEIALTLGFKSQH